MDANILEHKLVNPLIAPLSPVMGVDSWGLAQESDRRFKRIVARVFPPIIALMIIIPWVQLELEKAEEKPTPIQIINVLPEPPQAAIKPEPKPEEKPLEKAKPDTRTEIAKPAATKKEQPAPASASAAPVPSAREIAQQSGLMRFADQLAAVRSQNLVSAHDDRPLQLDSSVSSTVNSTSKADVLAAAKGSGGIGSLQGNGVTGSQNGTNLGTRRTASVQSGIGYGTGAAVGHGGSGTAPAAGRTLQEIQLAFDRSKSSFFAIFNRAARETPGMEAGKIVLSLTIAADGSVTQCQIVSSSFNDASLEEKILQRVRLMNFGAKNVPTFTYPNYPMNFIPS